MNRRYSLCCRAYLLDVTVPQDHPAGISTFTVLAGLGGSIGYIMGGINWEATSFGESIGGHVRVVFYMVLIIYMICIGFTITAMKVQFACTHVRAHHAYVFLGVCLYSISSFSQVH